MLEASANNSSADKSQSQVDREFIMIDYLREITTYISFLNEAMTTTANYLAEKRVKSKHHREKSTK